ncbi:MAG TPA: DegT/DnrJ/EryC1/StrS family aminotransferase [Bdellovibrionota bacterium]|jgi:dTDP-4-amino-4,6-dideoxygalactose transaminase
MVGIHDPSLSESELQEITAAFRSGWLSGGGEKVFAFEQELQRFFGSFCQPIACVNGSSALVLALRVQGVKPGDHVLVPDYGFVATANAVKQLGAEPIFLGPENGTFPVVTAKQIEGFFREAVDDSGCYRITGKPVRGMLYNEPYGFACPELSLCASLFAERGMFFVEDASQSIGVRLGGKFLGTFGTMGVMSFNGNKTITTGTGGVLFGKNEEAMGRARKLQHQSRSDPFEFYYDEHGYNFLMSNVLAGLGLAQARRLPEILGKKKIIRKLYSKALEGTSLLLAGSQLQEFPAWLNVVLFPKEVKSRELFRELAVRVKDDGFQLRPTFPPVTDYPMYGQSLREQVGKSREFFERGICLPSGAEVDARQVDAVVQSLLNHGKALELF